MGRPRRRAARRFRTRFRRRFALRGSPLGAFVPEHWEDRIYRTAPMPQEIPSERRCRRKSRRWTFEPRHPPNRGSRGHPVRRPMPWFRRRRGIRRRPCRGVASTGWPALSESKLKLGRGRRGAEPRRPRRRRRDGSSVGRDVATISLPYDEVGKARRLRHRGCCVWLDRLDRRLTPEGSRSLHSRKLYTISYLAVQIFVNSPLRMMSKSVSDFRVEFMLRFFDLELERDFRSTRPGIIRLRGLLPA